MSSRFMSNSAISLAGGFLVVVSVALTHVVAGWLAFAVAILVLLTSAIAQADLKRGLVQRILDGAISVLAIVMIIFSRVFTGAAIEWLSFAWGLGFVAVAYSGLVLNEIAEWRFEHGLPALHGLRLVHPLREHRSAA